MVRIGRAQSRIIALTILFLVVGIGLFMAQGLGSAKKFIKNTKFSGAEANSTGFILNNFQRTETKDGKTIWKVQAETGRYAKGTDSIELTRPYLVLFQDNGDVIELTSNQATLKLSGNALNTADLMGDVVMNINRQKFAYTQNATYDQNKNLINAPGYVKIEDQNMTIEGESMNANTLEQIMTLDRNVKTVIKKQLAKK